MLNRTQILLISALAISFTACSAGNNNTPVSSSPQQTGASVATSDLAGKQFAQEIEVLETPETAKAGETVKVPITVKNTSNFVWSSEGAKPEHLAYHWLDSNNQVVVFDGLRTVLPKNVPPQGSVKLEAEVKVPDKPGKYQLVFSMVEEAVAWFNDQGAEAETIPVNVTSQ